jgi:hypothetical protein
LEEEIEGWRKMHEKGMYSSSNVVRTFKSRRMRRVRQAACMGNKERQREREMECMHDFG